jgi:DNA-binding NarL/FixJ family response regulator
MTLALVRDLMFSSKITATARALGVACTVVREPAKLAAAAPTPLLLVDLNLAGAIEAASDYVRAHPGTEVVGFVSHTDAATISAAREAGVTRVMARSAFVERLPELLGE